MTIPTAISIAPNHSPIAKFLNQKDRCTCLRVSKAFRDTFLPYIWNALDLDDLAHYLEDPTHLEHFTSGLWHNGSLVRNLTCLDTDQSDLLPLFLETVVAPSCHNLRRLALRIPEEQRLYGWHFALIKNNKNLTGIELDAADISLDLIPAYLSESPCTNLRDLQLTFEMYCDWENLIRILDCCPSLVTLHLEEVVQVGTFDDFGNYYPPNVPLRQTNLEILGLKGPDSGDALMALLPFCPKLSHLQLSECLEGPFLQGINAALQHAPPSLTHLMFISDPELMETSDEMEVLSLIIALCYLPIRELHLVDLNVGSAALTAIYETHYWSLEVLVLRSGKSVSSNVVCDMLATLKRLRHLEIWYPHDHTDHLDAWALVKKPWACKRLEIIRIPIGHDSKHTIYRKNNGNSDWTQIIHVLSAELFKLPYLRRTSLYCLCGKTVMSKYHAKHGNRDMSFKN